MKSEAAGYRSIWLLLLGFCVAAGTVFGLSLSSRLPDNVARELTAEEAAEVIGRNSPLTEYVYLSPNADFPRGEEISRLTVHHMAEDLSLEELGAVFVQRDRQTSANYGIDSEGRVALYVEEGNRAWSSGSRDNDDRAVTIEVANDEIGGDWHVSDRAYEALVDLCTDICRRSGIQELCFTGDESGNLTLHRMFSSKTECPGPYLESRMEELAAEVNRRLGGK